MKDGGAAFPLGLGIGGANEGMSLRDYFAAAALQGWIARAVDSGRLAQDLARWAYAHADAMLAEREKT